MNTFKLKRTPSRGVYRASWGMFCTAFLLFVFSVRAQKLDSIVVKHKEIRYLLVYAGDSLAKVHQFKGEKILYVPKRVNYKLVRGKGFNSLYIDIFSVDEDLWERYYQALEDYDNQNQ